MCMRACICLFVCVFVFVMCRACEFVLCVRLLSVFHLSVCSASSSVCGGQLSDLR